MVSKKKLYAPVKPARSYEEQAQRLFEVHNLRVENADRARHILSTVNYYRLTTYGKHLRRPDDPEKFIDGVTLDDLYDLYQFDMGAISCCRCWSSLRCSCAPRFRIIWR